MHENKRRITNNGEAEKKFKAEKKKEERQLRKLGMEEEKIQELRTYDRAVFNSDRVYRKWNNNWDFTYTEQIIVRNNDYCFEEILKIAKEPELIYHLSQADEILQGIITMRFNGCSNREISQELGISTNAIRKRLKVFRNKTISVKKQYTNKDFYKKEGLRLEKFKD